ncbi:MAG: hypothetical protein ACPGVO_00200 [Spirulinaceae cyanobacterium]
MTPSLPIAYEEIINFFAAGPSPQSIVDFQPSAAVKDRVADLIFQEKTTGLGSSEKSELDHYLLLEHILRLTKARAYDHLPDGQSTDIAAESN